MQFQKMVERKDRIEVIKFGESMFANEAFDPNKFFNIIRNRFPQLKFQKKTITIEENSSRGNDEFTLVFFYHDPREPRNTHENFVVWRKIILRNNQYLVVRRIFEDMKLQCLEMDVMEKEELAYHWEPESQ